VNIVGPPEHFTVTTSRSQVVPRGNATLKCEVKGKDRRHLNSYYWHWRFNEKEIRENRRYKLFYNHLPPNFCQQSNVWAVLQIMNISEGDLGQYECALQLSNITIAENDISFYDFGKHFLRIFNISIFDIITHFASAHFNLPHRSSTIPYELNSFLSRECSQRHIPHPSVSITLSHITSFHFLTRTQLLSTIIGAAPYLSSSILSLSHLTSCTSPYTSPKLQLPHPRPI